MSSIDVGEYVIYTGHIKPIFARVLTVMGEGRRYHLKALSEYGQLDDSVIYSTVSEYVIRLNGIELAYIKALMKKGRRIDDVL